MPHTRSTPTQGELWLSRPPHALLARVRSVDLQARPPMIEYELMDEDGLPLSCPVSTVLDSNWWTNFQPLVRREG